jgi:serine phosphatase RsbU (regulator of sigma subunit)
VLESGQLHALQGQEPQPGVEGTDESSSAPLSSRAHTQAARAALPADVLGRVVLLDDVLSGCATAEQVIGATVGPGLQAFEAAAALVGLSGFRLRIEPVAASIGLDRLANRCRGLSLDSPLPIADAIRTGMPVTLQTIPDDVVDERTLAQLGATRAVALPILAARGVVGAVWLFLGEDRSETEGQLFDALLARIAGAIDRTRLLESERRLRVRAEQSAARLSRLQSLTSGLSAALAPVDVADAVMTHALAELGATGGTCFMLSDDATLKPVGSIGSEAESGRAIALTEDDPLGAVLRRSGVVIMPGDPAGDEHAGPRAVVPLAIRGEILGAIELLFSRDREIDAELRSFLAALGAQCAQAIERARLYGQRAREAHVLQASLMPPALPAVPGLDIAASYRPFGDGTVVGGDFYDLYELGGGRWGLVVGDVSGKGVEAAAITSLARYTTRAAALLGSRPAEVLATLNQVLLADMLDERFCTIVLSVLQPSTEGVEVTMSLGGHPRPLLFERQTRSVRPVGTLGTAVGLVPDPLFHDSRITLRGGDVLVFFTDGCVDFRTDGGTTSDESVLPDVLREHAGEPAVDLTRRLEQAVQDSSGGQSTDDAALLVVRAAAAPS